MPGWRDVLQRWNISLALLATDAPAGPRAGPRARLDGSVVRRDRRPARAPAGRAPPAPRRPGRLLRRASRPRTRRRRPRDRRARAPIARERTADWRQVAARPPAAHRGGLDLRAGRRARRSGSSADPGHDGPAGLRADLRTTSCSWPRIRRSCSWCGAAGRCAGPAGERLGFAPGWREALAPVRASVRHGRAARRLHRGLAPAARCSSTPRCAGRPPFPGFSRSAGTRRSCAPTA